MDPRKAAKVTAPDLTRAFEEGSGGVGKGEAVAGLRVYLTLLFKGDEPKREVLDFSLSDLSSALVLLEEHLSKGAGHGAVIVVDTEAPDVLSQIDS